MTLDKDLEALLALGAVCVKVKARGKVPIGTAWPTLATDSASVIAGWIERGYNLGLLCGAARLIDVEYDTPDGRATLDRLGLLDVETPTWESGRGQHRLFRLACPLPEWGVRKIGGVEFRVGGRPAQSVVPPSMHTAGRPYRWLVSPQQCDPVRVTLADLGIKHGGA